MEEYTKKLQKLVKNRKKQKVVFRIGSYRSSSNNPHGRCYDGYDYSDHDE